MFTTKPNVVKHLEGRPRDVTVEIMDRLGMVRIFSIEVVGHILKIQRLGGCMAPPPKGIKFL